MRRVGQIALFLLLAVAVGAEPLAATRYFEFHADPWMGVHHFLYAWATQEKSDTVPQPHGRPMPDKALATGLDAAEKEAWEAAVDFYRRRLGARRLTFDESLIALKRRHWDPAFTAGHELAAEQREIEEVIASVLPVYRRHWWPAHERQGRAWLDRVRPALARWEEKMVPALERIYGGRWPARVTRIDLVAYTDYYGAYNTGEPHVTLATGMDKNAYPHGVEIVFHEASHSQGMEDGIRAAIAAAGVAEKIPVPRDLWHALIFFTTGELTRRYFADEGITDYVPYARREGLYRPNSPWQRYEHLLQKYWLPAMDGDPEDRLSALRTILAENRRLFEKLQRAKQGAKSP